jgi:hypothetical protein
MELARMSSVPASTASPASHSSPASPASPAGAGGAPRPARTFVRLAVGAILIAAATRSAPAASASDPLKIPRKDILTITTINAGPSLSATLAEFFTGDKSEKSGVDLLLGLHAVSGDERKLLAVRDYNAEVGGYVSRGSLQVIDLDRDGTNEILVEYHHKENPGSIRIDLDVLKVAADRLVLRWSGPIRVDTTSPSLGLSPADREKFVREIDFECTAEAHGDKICFQKTVSVAAGASIVPPRMLPEQIPLSSPRPVSPTR